MAINKQISWGVVLMYIQMFLSVAISIFTTPIIIDMLGQSEYGLYNLSASIISYLNLFTLGFGSSYIRFYSKYKAKNDEEGIKKLNGLYFTVFCILGVIACLAGAVLICNVEILFNQSYSATDLRLAKILMIFLTFNVGISFPMSVFQSYITSQEKFIFQKVINLGKTILSPVMSIALLYLGFGSIGMVVTTTIISVIVDVINLIYCFCKLKFKLKFGKFDFKLLKDILVYSSFIAINLLIDQINGQTDKLILGKMINAGAVAIYAVADQIRHMYTSLSSAISGVFAPTVHRIVNSIDDEKEKNNRLTDLFIKIGRIQFYILFLVLTGFIFFGQNFIRIWVGSEYSIAYYLTLLLIGPAIVPLIQNIGIEIQRAKNKHQFRSIVYLFVAIFNLLISILLCKYIGIVGVALGTCIANVIGTITIMNIYYHKKIGINIIRFWKEIFKASIGSIFAIVCGILMFIFVDFSNTWVYFSCILAYSLIYIVGVYLISFNKTEKTFLKSIIASFINSLKTLSRRIGMSKIVVLLQKIYYFFVSRLFCKNRVVFISFGGKQYSDNPKAISDYLLKNYPTIKQVWLFREPKKYKNLPKNIKCKKMTGFTTMHYIASSKVVIDNDHLVYYWKLAKMPKRKDQLFIQTWHGDMGLKRCFYETENFKAKIPFTLEKKGVFDYFITGSKFAEPLVNKRFKYEGKLLKTGCPRNDILFKDNIEQYKKVRKHFNIDEDTKILLYAPTFRQNIEDNTEKIDFDKVIKVLERTTKQKWVVAFRGHHVKDYACNEKCLDGKKGFDDMADIMVASDMLITDYSSCAGDFALLNRPVILYVDDYNDYTSNDRGIHFKLEEGPYMFVKTNEELLKLLENLTETKAKENCKEILNFYGCYEQGSSCEKVVEVILKNIKLKNK